jgi:putative ABC transport system substrate-binding protein
LTVLRNYAAFFSRNVIACELRRRQHMTRREFIALLSRAAAWPLVVALPAGAAQKLPRLCVVTFDPGTLQTNRFGVFFNELSRLGYVDGKTIAIDYLSADGRGERFSVLAEECLRRGADVIAVSTTPAAKAAKAATSTVPIVMFALVDPTESGFVASLARPGGNITGQAIPASELGTKRLQLLTELLPGVKRVRVLFYPADPIDAPQIRQLKQAASTLGLTLQLQETRSAEDFPSAFEDQENEPAQALLTTSVSIFLVNRSRIIELAMQHRLPAVYPFVVSAREGGLMAYSQEPAAWQRGAAGQVDRILKGANPGDLPVEQPTKFELVINLKTAKALGLTVPQSLLQRADEVLE